MGLARRRLSLEEMLGALWVSCCIAPAFFWKIKVIFEKNQCDKLPKERLNLKVTAFVPLPSHTYTKYRNFGCQSQLFTTIRYFLIYYIRNCKEHCLYSEHYKLHSPLRKLHEILNFTNCFYCRFNNSKDARWNCWQEQSAKSCVKENRLTIPLSQF